jgi:hypothetical protein
MEKMDQDEILQELESLVEGKALLYWSEPFRKQLTPLPSYATCWPPKKASEGIAARTLGWTG